MKLLLAALACAARIGSCTTVQWAQTARNGDGSLVLLKEMEPLEMQPLSVPDGPSIMVDSRQTYQEFAGFGGAFTEASAINWKNLTKADQAEVIRLYFSDPADGGLGYTMGRVPINSCDFSPASYNFDDTPGDVELEHFDNSVQHDVDSGMVPMIQAAVKAVKARGQQLRLLASPWSPPAWMKLPGPLGEPLMTASATPNGLDPKMQAPWAKYFSKWLAAYEKHGVSFWGVTVQNEPEATAGWESMLYTPEFMASFVKEHLGPVLRADWPGLKIFGFDHNKDHVVEWAQGLYKDPDAKQFFDGVGVHWYGGLNTENLQAAHDLAPDKDILATEACNCVGNVILSEPNQAAWWTRAERLALDILEDLRFWTVGWIDWNLLLNKDGGPNHLKNLCDANIIADPDQALGKGTTLIKQATFYYMGHFSRYLLPGGKRVSTKQTVETALPPLTPADVKNGNALSFLPCKNDNAVQRWKMGAHGGVVAAGTNEAPGSDGYSVGGECMERCISGECWFPKVQVWACGKPSPSGDALHGGPGNQKWEVKDVLLPLGGSQLINPATGKCLTAVVGPGWTVGLDAGVTVTAAQIMDCYPPGTRNQTFLLAGDGQGETIKDGTFTIGGTGAAAGLCLQPQLDQLPKFDAVAFSQPDGSVSLVAMNTNDYGVPLTIYDEASAAGVEHTVPPHAIHTYRWNAAPAAAAVAAASTATVATATAAATTALLKQQLDAKQPTMEVAQDLGKAGVGKAGVVAGADKEEEEGHMPDETTSMPYVLAALVVALLVVLIVSSLIVRRIATVKLFSDGSDQFWPVAAPYEEEEEDFVVRYREFDGVQLRSR